MPICTKRTLGRFRQTQFQSTDYRNCPKTDTLNFSVACLPKNLQMYFKTMFQAFLSFLHSFGRFFPLQFFLNTSNVPTRQTSLLQKYYHLFFPLYSSLSFCFSCAYTPVNLISNKTAINTVFNPVSNMHTVMNFCFFSTTFARESHMAL